MRIRKQPFILQGFLFAVAVLFGVLAFYVFGAGIFTTGQDPILENAPERTGGAAPGVEQNEGSQLDRMRIGLEPCRPDSTPASIATGNLDVITGRAVYSDGTPAACIRIYAKNNPLETGPRTEIQEFLASYDFFTVSRSDGTFSINVRPDFRYYLMAFKQGYLPVVRHASPGSSCTFLLNASAGPLNVSVVDACTQEPIPCAKVTLRIGLRHYESKISMVSDDKGMLRFDESPHLINMVGVDADGYEEASWSMVRYDALNNSVIELFPQRTINVSLRLWDTRDHSLIPAANINGEAMSADSEGVYKVQHCLDREALAVTSQGYCSKRLMTDLLEEDKLYEIDMAASGTCYGHVVGPACEPVADVQIVPVFEKPGDPLQKIANVVTPAFSAPDGGFVLEGVPLDVSFDVHLKKENGFLRVHRGIKCIMDGMYLGALEYGWNGRITGKVVDEGGTGISGAWIMVRDPNGSISRAMTDRQGCFNLCTGSYVELFVSKHGYYFYREEHDDHNPVEVDAGKVQYKEIVMATSEYISGVVVDNEGKPVPSAIVVFRLKNLSEQRGQGLISDVCLADDRGRFVLMGVVANNEYYVDAYRGKTPTERRYSDAAVIRGGDRDVVIEVAELGVVCGTLRDLKGNLLRGTRLLHEDQLRVCLMPGIVEDRTRGEGQEIRTGRFSFVVHPGQYSLFVQSSKYSHETVYINVAAGEILDVPLTLQLR